MRTKMTHATRMEFANAIRGRYAVAANKDKHRILAEFVAATGYHEKSAIRVLNTPPEPKRRRTRQRPLLYDEAARGTLIVLCAWHAGEIRPTFSIETKPRYLRSLQKVPTQILVASPPPASTPVTPPAPVATSAKMHEKPEPVYAEPGHARIQALRMAWPIVCRRLEEFPTINAMQLFEEPKSCAFSFQVGLPANSTKRSSSGSVSGARRLEHAASSLGPRPIVGSATNRVVDVPISSGTIGKRWLDALKSSRIKPHSNSSSSSRPATQDNTARDSFTRCRSEYGRGANKPCSG